jgi:hypothetical protein
MVGNLLESRRQAVGMLRPHPRQGTNDDQVERSLQDFDALGFFTGHRSEEKRGSTGLSITEAPEARARREAAERERAG